MIRFRPRLAPTLFTIPMLLVCVALGVWQLQRLEGKTGLHAQREPAAAAAPARPPQTLAEARAMEFHPVVDDGVLLHDKEIFVRATGPTAGIECNGVTPLLASRRNSSGGPDPRAGSDFTC